MNRRSVLRGAGSILVGLPLLDVMVPRVAHAATPPMRMVVSYAGTTHGTARILNPAAGALPATLPVPCAPLTPIRNLVSMVSNLEIPRYSPGQAVVPGAALSQQHGMVMAPMLAGMHSREGMPVMANGHTVDQVVADAIGGGTRVKSVQASIQAAGYGGGAAKGVQSGRLENGRVRGLAPITSPSLLFSTLFGTPPPSGGGAGSAAAALEARKQKSVLDFVLADRTRLVNDLGARDRARLDQHFTELRELELRIGAAPITPSASCSVPVAPGTDPALGATGTFGGWSNETLRGDLMADVIALGLACDITRVASLLVSWDQCFLKTQDALGTYGDVHATGHSGTNDQIFANTAWHLGRFARVVKRLSELPENGGTVLDSTFVALVFAEGSNSHSMTSMTAFVAGVPSKLRMGQHIVSNLEHPARLMIAGMQAVGVNSNTLGEVTGAYAGLLK